MDESVVINGMGEYLKDTYLYVDRAIGEVAFTTLMFWDVDVTLFCGLFQFYIHISKP
jgi:hypothetical protein